MSTKFGRRLRKHMCVQCPVRLDTSATFASYQPALTKGSHLFPLWDFTGKPPQCESNLKYHLFTFWQLVIFSRPKHPKRLFYLHQLLSEERATFPTSKKAASITMIRDQV